MIIKELKHMNKTAITIFLLCFFKSLLSFSQDYIVHFSKDTVFCSNIDFSTNTQGFIDELSYKDNTGKNIQLKKRKNIPIINTISSAGTIYDRMPLKTKKPYSYHRFGKRLVSGKLCVSKYDNRVTKQVYKPQSQYNPVGGFKAETSGTYLFQLTMPDGKIIKINKRNIKKIIKPYMINCEKFKNEYKGNFSHEEEQFTQMIGLYNKVCN